MEMIAGHVAISPPKGVPVWDVDPYSVEILRDPEPYYAELRAKGPVVYIPKYSVLAVGRYPETKEIFSDWERFVSSRGVGLDDFAHGQSWRPNSIILEVDPPEHTAVRKVMIRAMSPKVAAGYKQMFFDEAARLINDLLTRDGFDAVGDFAEVFPTNVFPKAVGMTDVNKRHLVDYGAMVFNSLGPDNDIRKATMVKAAEIIPWINAACARDRLTGDGMGGILYAAADAGDITHDEAGLLVRSFLSAGVDTTVSSIGNALVCLAQHPAEFEKLKADPSLARPCFEEVLRYTSPVHTFCRTAKADTQVSGVDIAEHSKVLCVLGSANMDPDKWDSPQEFRINRKPAGHLAFGVGVHGCVGQNIARAEMEAVLTTLAQKVDRIELLEQPVWRPNNAMHALDRMMVRFHSA
ncbi:MULTISPECIES: cytochrome P450 [unclassified Sulfitobacter]|uniref:cytochrome P450 n=1 Tax=unclassified Sulfitobacter TaxID=196795 RepID=UPI0020CF20E2|nr:cytochrome P450 [Sulfitobacter sp. HGT1]